MYKGAVKLFQEHPFFGIGWDMWNPVFSAFSFNRHPHNIVLEVLTELGIMGFIIFLAIFIYPFWRMRFSIWVKDDLALLLLIVFLYNLFAAQMSGDLTDNRFLFTSLGLMISYSSQIKLRNRHKRLLQSTNRLKGADSRSYFSKAFG
jgi:O-antigen ligase